MSVRLALGPHDAERFEFGSSPGSEALRSLHVLTAVKRHPLHISWVLEMRTRLDTRLKTDLDAFRFWFADFLAAYWDACLAEDWPGLEAHLHAEIARRFQALSRQGPVGMLADLSDNVSASEYPGAVNRAAAPDRVPAGTRSSVTIRPPGARGAADPLDVVLGEGDRVLLLPSHFMWPELAVAVHRDRTPDRETTTVVLSYALAGIARQGRAPVPAEDLLSLLRAAGDPTRPACKSWSSWPAAPVRPASWPA